MPKVMIVDDEPLAVVKLEHLCGGFPQLEVEGRFTDPLEALEQAPAIQPDIAFVDISMPDMDGMELAQRIQAACPAAHIVFVTAYSQHAVQAFESNALDYLMKPVSEKRFAKTVERLMTRTAPHSGTADANVKYNPPVMIRCFGKLEIQKKGVQPPKWRTAKVKELFAYLLLNRRREIYRNELCEALWPNMDSGKVLSNVNTTMYYLRSALQKIEPRLQIEYRHNYYCLHTGGLPCDEDLLCELWDNREALCIENLPDFEQGLRLYRGPLFEDVHCEWAGVTRDLYNSRFSELYRVAAAFCMENSLYDQAIAYAAWVVERFPLNKPCWTLLIKAYQQKGQEEFARKMIMNMEEAFREGSKQPQSRKA